MLVGLVGARSPVVRGEELRTVLVRAFGPRSVRSARFTVTATGEAFVIEGTGFGHGAGLCQAGALARLRAGASVDDVIAHYYPGVVDSPAGRARHVIGAWVRPRLSALGTGRGAPAAAAF